MSTLEQELRAATGHDFLQRSLGEVDRDIADAIALETARQNDTLELIASENHVSTAVLTAMGSVFTNKYAESYPGKRYYGGCGPTDVVENIAIERANDSSTPSMRTCSRTPARRPTWPSISASSSRATRSWGWTSRMAATSRTAIRCRTRAATSRSSPITCAKRTSASTTTRWSSWPWSTSRASSSAARRPTRA